MKKAIMLLITLCFCGGLALAQTAASTSADERFIFSKRKFAQRHHWYWGVGAVVSDIPVMESRFKVPFSQVLYEYNFGDLNSNVRFALGGGLYGLNAILPVPAFQPSLYIGSENSEVMGRFSVGAFSDIVVGGHSGVMLSAAVVIKNRLDISAVMVPFGTQPVRPYPEILGSLEEEFQEISTAPSTLDINGKPLVVYDNKRRHPKDPAYDTTGTMKYYSSYDIHYGNGEYAYKTRSNPGDFDYIKPREYIKFPYFGIMITFRH
jgi:hypothetical protein